jgi:hypothetical protein
VPASSVASPSRGGLVDDVVTAVDVKGLAGDQARRVVREQRGGDTDVVDADQEHGDHTEVFLLLGPLSGCKRSDEKSIQT